MKEEWRKEVHGVNTDNSCKSPLSHLLFFLNLVFYNIIHYLASEKKTDDVLVRKNSFALEYT